MSHGIFLCEGRNDRDLLAVLLRDYFGAHFDPDLNKSKLQRDVPTHWHGLFESKFPGKRGETELGFYDPIPMPYICTWENGDSVALFEAGGETGIAETMLLLKGISNLSEILTFLGIFFDADAEEPHAKYVKMYPSLKALFDQYELNLPILPGQVSKNRTRAGAFLMPDNSNKGKLEDFLLEVASQSYPEGSQHAVTFVTSCAANEKHSKIDKKKAKIAAISAVTVKGGASRAVSLKKGEWFSRIIKPGKGEARAIRETIISPGHPSLAPILQFLTNLLSLPLA